MVRIFQELYVLECERMEMQKDDPTVRTLRDLKAPEAPPFDEMREIEVKLEQAKKMLREAGVVTCSRCGRSMAKPRSDVHVSDALCSHCNPSSKVVESDEHEHLTIIPRRERRHPGGVKQHKRSRRNRHE